MSATNIGSCLDALARLCIPVALVRQLELPKLDGTVVPPEGAALWSSSYARLLLWPVDSNEQQRIALAADEGEGWLDAELDRAQQPPGVSVDGYLVLALPMAPAPEASEAIRKVELSARICRKHFVWPSSTEALAVGAEPWARVADITVLGLPAVTTAADGSLYWPEIGVAADNLWCDLQKSGAPAVARADAEALIPTGSDS